MSRLVAGILLLAATSFAAPPPDAASRSAASSIGTRASSSTSSAMGIGSLIINAFNAVPTGEGILTSTAASSAPKSEPTVCGDIIDAHDNDNRFKFPAKQAYDCLTSVPFNPAVATRFLRYYNDTIQFQSTLAYLKDPPSSYQQPSIDLVESLRQIQQDIDRGVFRNQYAFEATLQKVIYATHDDHLRLSAGILAAFSFYSPYGISSVSVDGVQLPKVYLTKHLNADPTNASPISKINDQDVITFLSQFAAINAIGGLEPHTDWNSLMSSSALGIQGRFNYFGGLATFYPGEHITFTLENNTKITDTWRAYYNNPGNTGPLATGGDFYNFFVLGLSPASYNYGYSPKANNNRRDTPLAPPVTTTARRLPAASVCDGLPSGTRWSAAAYPMADIAQPELAVNGGGFISGYFLEDAGIAVLSIPSFNEYDGAVNTFSKTVKCFIESSKSANLKIVIDVQQNQGGNPLLAIDAFRQFFPLDEPWATSRLRAHSTADILGNAITKYWGTLPTHTDLYYLLSNSEWLASDRLNNETNQNFTSWQEFYGPHEYSGDNFTTNQRYDFSSFVFDIESLASSITAEDLQKSPSNATPPYAASDIVILSDGLCSSACALFLELMHHQAHVRTVVVGGRPSYGPMQTPGGTRGARSYAAGILDQDLGLARIINETTQGFNLRDQIRKDPNPIPLQFIYEAADCRIFFTKKTYNNYTLLWRYAAEAIWVDPSKCVKDSTGYAKYGSDTDTIGPPQSAQSANITHGMSGVAQIGGPYNMLPVSSSHALSDGSACIQSFQGRVCTPTQPNIIGSGNCPPNFNCVEAARCDPGGHPATEYQCWPICFSPTETCLHGPCQFKYERLKSGYWVGTCPSRKWASPCGVQTKEEEAALQAYRGFACP